MTYVQQLESRLYEVTRVGPGTKRREEDSMKALFASQGNTLDSLLASRTDSAEWYVIVDLVSHEVSAVRAIGQPLQDVLAAACAHGVGVFITGSRDVHSQVTITADLTTISFAHEITLREALGRWENGQLELANNETQVARHSKPLTMYEKDECTRSKDPNRQSRGV